MLFLLRVFDSCDFLWIFFCRAFEYFAFTLVAILSESDGDSQSLEAWLLRFIEFMSIDCDSLTSLLLSTLFVSWSETWVEVRDVSFVISCCASGTDNGWSWFCIIPSWLRETGMWFISIGRDSQSLGTCLFRFIEFMSMDCDSLTSLIYAIFIIFYLTSYFTIILLVDLKIKCYICD